MIVVDPFAGYFRVLLRLLTAPCFQVCALQSSWTSGEYAGHVPQLRATCDELSWHISNRTARRQQQDRASSHLTQRLSMAWLVSAAATSMKTTSGRSVRAAGRGISGSPSSTALVVAAVDKHEVPKQEGEIYSTALEVCVCTSTLTPSCAKLALPSSQLGT